MSAALWPALFTAAAVLVVVGLPRAAALRLDLLLRAAAVQGRADTAAARAARAGAGRGPAAAAAAAGLGTGARGPRGAASGALALGGVLAGVLTGSVVGLLVGGGAAAGAWAAWRRRQAAQERQRERRSAAEACVALAAELRAGRSPAEALGTAAELARGPAQGALLAAAAAARLGGDVPAALVSGVAAGSTAPEVLRGLGACWRVCARAGSGLAAAVDRLSEGLRSQQAQEQAVEAALAGPRASAAMLAVLPLAGVALAAGLGARPGHVLLHTPVGVGCLVLGLVLDGAGLWWTARLVARAGRVR